MIYPWIYNIDGLKIIEWLIDLLIIDISWLIDIDWLNDCLIDWLFQEVD